MLPHQIEETLVQTPLAYIPWGALEWHGRHLAIGNDGIKAAALCDRIAEKTGGVVLPPVYAAYSTMKRAGYRHALEMEETTVQALAYDLLRGLEAEGFRVVVILTGHYASRHVAALEEVVEEFGKGKEIRVWVLPEYEVVTDLGYEGDHAGKWETSILMHLRPEWVDMEQLSADLDEKLEGVNGDDPRVHASPEVGREIVEAIVARTAERVMDLLPGEEENNA